jgi:acetyltransferase EpsM
VRILIVGAGGHAHVVADAIGRLARAGEDVSIVGLLDDARGLHGTAVLGWPVLGAVEEIGHIAHDACVLAVGDNRVRRELFARLAGRGERFATVVHPTAVIGTGVEIGAGTFVAAQAVLNPEARVGENVIVNTAAVVEHHCVVGAHAHVAPGARLGGQAAVEEGVLVGIGATVMPRCSVGAWSTVGAGSVVHRPVPPNVVVVGVPARPRGRGGQRPLSRGDLDPRWHLPKTSLR